MTEQNDAIFKVAKNVKLFAGLDRQQLVNLIACADKSSHAAGELYFDEGDVGESFYIIFIGEVIIERQRDGQWIPLAELKSGDSFGEVTLVGEKKRTARVRASTDCVALFFPLQRLKDHPDITSALVLNIAKVMVNRLKISNNSVMELFSKITQYERGAMDAQPVRNARKSVTPEIMKQPDPAIPEILPVAVKEWWLETTISG